MLSTLTLTLKALVAWLEHRQNHARAEREDRLCEKIYGIKMQILDASAGVGSPNGLPDHERVVLLKQYLADIQAAYASHTCRALRPAAVD
jgi:hypothetical protein